MMMTMLSTGCRFDSCLSHVVLIYYASTGIVLDIGSSECRALAIAFGRPILASFTGNLSPKLRATVIHVHAVTPVGVDSAYRRFHNTIQILWGSTDDCHEIIPLQLDRQFTKRLFEKVAVACDYSVMIPPSSTCGVN